MTDKLIRQLHFLTEADKMKNILRQTYIIDKSRQKFNASIAEVDTQDLCQTLTLGIAVVSGDGKHAKQMIDELVRYAENNTEAELVEVGYN